jgi:hypothetical protein
MVLSLNQVVEQGCPLFPTQTAFHQVVRPLFGARTKPRDALHFLHFIRERRCRIFRQGAAIASNFGTPARAPAAIAHGFLPVSRWHGY